MKPALKILLIFVFLHGKTFSQQINKVSYYGTVVSSADFKSLDKVDLFIQGFNENVSIDTDSNGVFCFEVRSANSGKIIVRISKTGFFFKEELLNFNPPKSDSNAFIKFELTPIVIENYTISPIFLDKHFKLLKNQKLNFDNIARILKSNNTFSVRFLLVTERKLTNMETSELNTELSRILAKYDISEKRTEFECCSTFRSYIISNIDKVPIGMQIGDTLTKKYIDSLESPQKLRWAKNHQNRVEIIFDEDRSIANVNQVRAQEMIIEMDSTLFSQNKVLKTGCKNE